MPCSSCSLIERSFFFFFFFLQLILHSLLLQEEGPLICYLTVGSKQVHKQKEIGSRTQPGGQKKALVQDTSKRQRGHPLALIFSSNDKQSLPSEEREESKEVQESKGKGFFLVGGQTGEVKRLPYLTDRFKSCVRH